ncbi:MAG: DUF4476 domain-containing protein [Chitinophagaceae bacterium]|nr:DUF4476 domain-containing protein [Chitinophagaceae bacterium]
MNGVMVRSGFMLLLVILLPVYVWAQLPRFIYLQTENKLPFYVKIDKRILTASDPGFLIVPGLSGNAYPVVIGFLQKEWPEMNVTINVQDASAGFLLKNEGDKGWSLVNLQTNQRLEMRQSKSFQPGVEIQSGAGEFARVLAEVVNDPNIAEITVTGTLPDTTGLTKDNKAETENTGIIKLKADSTSTGQLITYLDNTGAGTDSVKVFIPVNKTETLPQNEAITASPATDSMKSIKERTGTRFINMELQNPNASTDSGSLKKDDLVITEKKKRLTGNPETPNDTLMRASIPGKDTLQHACKKTATQKEFLKLRQQMAAEENEKNMIKAAGKRFAVTCFTAEQVKNLGVLFISEEEKYKFYVTAYPFVSDPENIAVLEEQLTDEYFRSRLKVMRSH